MWSHASINLSVPGSVLHDQLSLSQHQMMKPFVTRSSFVSVVMSSAMKCNKLMKGVCSPASYRAVLGIFESDERESYAPLLKCTFT